MYFNVVADNPLRLIALPVKKEEIKPLTAVKQPQIARAPNADHCGRKLISMEKQFSGSYQLRSTSI
jgi:hypothetical protein